MDPELPYLRKTELFNDVTKDGVRSFSQVKPFCDKALQHFNKDEKLIYAQCDSLVDRVNTRFASNVSAAWEVYWPRFKDFVASEFPEPPTNFESPTEFFDSFLDSRRMKDRKHQPEDIMQAAYWVIQLIEERFKIPDPEPVPLDVKHLSSIVIRLVDNFRRIGFMEVSKSDPFYKSLVNEISSDVLHLPIIKGMELIGKDAAMDDEGPMSMLGLTLGDFFDGDRHVKDTFNASYSLDDTSALMLLLSDQLLRALNEDAPNLDKIAKLSERLKDTEFNFIRLKRETPVIGTKSLDPMRSKIGGGKSPWHVEAVQYEIDKLDPDFSWKLIFKALGKLGNKASHPDILSITCTYEELIVTPTSQHRRPVTIQPDTLKTRSYRKPSRI